MSPFDSIKSPLPNFIVIGPGKSGTSWLYEIFNTHPQVGMSSAKETLYFETEYHRGPQWYAKFFRKLTSSGISAVGEISNTYIFSALAAERIAASFPEVRIIATLRNPIDRAFSHFLFERRNGNVGDSFDEAIERRPDLLSRGLYDVHLEPYFQHFPASQRLILIYDDMVDDIIGYSDQLFAFLGIESCLGQEILSRKVLGASEARNKHAAKLVVSAGHLVRRLGFPEIVTQLKATSLAQLLFKPIDPARKPAMSTQTRDALRNYFREDVCRLSERLDRDLIKLWLDK